MPLVEIRNTFAGDTPEEKWVWCFLRIGSLFWIGIKGTPPIVGFSLCRGILSASAQSTHATVATPILPHAQPSQQKAEPQSSLSAAPPRATPRRPASKHLPVRERKKTRHEVTTRFYGKSLAMGKGQRIDCSVPFTCRRACTSKSSPCKTSALFQMRYRSALSESNKRALDLKEKIAVLYIHNQQANINIL